MNHFLDRFSEYLAHRKGLLPIIGLVLIILNYILQISPLSGWIVQTNLLLHIGLVIAIIGFLLAWAL